MKFLQPSEDSIQTMRGMVLNIAEESISTMALVAGIILKNIEMSFDNFTQTLYYTTHDSQNSLPKDRKNFKISVMPKMTGNEVTIVLHSIDGTELYLGYEELMYIEDYSSNFVSLFLVLFYDIELNELTAGLRVSGWLSSVHEILIVTDNIIVPYTLFVDADLTLDTEKTVHITTCGVTNTVFHTGVGVTYNASSTE